MSKDLFSDQSKAYALYRPQYPKELFDYISSFVPNKKAAWDCATGNGQCAVALAQVFEQVLASDISLNQLKQAPLKANLEYILCPAEQTPFADNSFELITVAQAYHWLNWQKFYAEANRVGKPECVVAVWMYDLLQSEEPAINELIRWFYKEITGPYWDAERRYVDEHYTTVDFRFTPLPTKDFFIQKHLSLESLLGYFSSWSATQNYIKANGVSPVALVTEQLQKVWEHGSKKTFAYPLYLKLGRISK